MQGQWQQTSSCVMDSCCGIASKESAVKAEFATIFLKVTSTWFWAKFGIVVIATKIKDSDGNRGAAIVAAV